MLQNLMFHRVDITRPTETKDTSGGIVESFAALYSAVPANVQPITAADAIIYEQRKIKATHTVYFIRDLSLTSKDRITYGSRTFFIVGIRNLIELNRVWAVDCEEYS